MYTFIWNKYLPIIRILLKRSATAEQTLDLNKIDFERVGSARKAGYKFTIELTNGKVGNIISGSPMASELAALLLQDEVVKALVINNNYEISLNTKYQLHIKNCPLPAGEPGQEKEEIETDADPEQE